MRVYVWACRICDRITVENPESATEFDRWSGMRHSPDDERSPSLTNILFLDWWTTSTGLTIAGREYREEERGELPIRYAQRGEKNVEESPWEEPPSQMTGHKSTTMESVASTHFIKTNEHVHRPLTALRRPLIAPLNRSGCVYAFVWTLAERTTV